ncbi:MAG TPA: cyclase family protein [Bdellovibrionales bacterium]|nr:cyclase family protein [Bdellovibrionales bacterium]
MKRIYDISPVISERIGVFPGDVSFRRNVSLEFSKGHNLVLSSIQTTLHLGAHADGPNHYSKTGEGIGARDVSLYFGSCLVVHAIAVRGTRVSREHLGDEYQKPGAFKGVKRVLVKTGSFPDPDHWNSDFSSFDPKFIEELANEGVKLIGIDTPSIDPEDSKDLPSHAAVAKHDLAILEGIILDKVPEGKYTLLALPLKLENADAAPVRAILIDDAGKAFSN